MAAQHNHPIDYIGSIAAPPFIVLAVTKPSHSIIKLQWILWVLTANYDDHCGYSFPWSPVRWFPLASLTDHHEFHHSRNQGCYASKLSVYDKVLGTEEKYHRWRSRRPIRGD